MDAACFILLILQAQSSLRPVSRFAGDIKFAFFTCIKLLVTQTWDAQHSTTLWPVAEPKPKWKNPFRREKPSSAAVCSSCNVKMTSTSDQTATTAASTLISWAVARSFLPPVLFWPTLDWSLARWMCDVSDLKSTVIQLHCKVKLFLQHIIRVTKHQNCCCFAFSQRRQLLSCSALNWILHCTFLTTRLPMRTGLWLHQKILWSFNGTLSGSEQLDVSTNLISCNKSPIILRMSRIFFLKKKKERKKEATKLSRWVKTREVKWTTRGEQRYLLPWQSHENGNDNQPPCHSIVKVCYENYYRFLSPAGSNVSCKDVGSVGSL